MFYCVGLGFASERNAGSDDDGSVTVGYGAGDGAEGGLAWGVGELRLGGEKGGGLLLGEGVIRQAVQKEIQGKADEAVLW